jgi:hypothetical protein
MSIAMKAKKPASYAMHYNWWDGWLVYVDGPVERGQILRVCGTHKSYIRATPAQPDKLLPSDFLLVAKHGAHPGSATIGLPALAFEADTRLLDEDQPVFLGADGSFAPDGRVHVGRVLRIGPANIEGGLPGMVLLHPRAGAAMVHSP